MTTVRGEVLESRGLESSRASAPRMRFSLMIEGNEGVGWEHWLALADACERHGYDGLFRSDHYLSVFAPAQRGSSDAWTTVAALAARTQRLRIGTIVTPVTFRHPSVLAKVVATIDHVSGGRVEVGLGAGWYEAEHRAHGLAFPAAPVRFDQLTEQLEILQGLFTKRTFSFQGDHYRLSNCAFLPKPVQRPHPPIIIGGKGGPRLAGLVARFADEFNSNQGSPAECRARYTRVHAALEARGRDPSTLTTSVMTGCVVGATDSEYRQRLRQVADWMNTDWRTLLHTVGSSWVLGTPDQAAHRLAAFRDAGAQRVMLQHNLHSDLDTVELLAREVFPNAV